MSVPAGRVRRTTESSVGRAKGYPWSWAIVVGIVAVVDFVASAFVTHAWLGESPEFLYDTRIVLAVLVLVAAPVVALGFAGRLVFGTMPHLARTGGLVWASTLGLIWALTLRLEGAGDLVDEALRVTPETLLGVAFTVVMTFLLAWASMGLGAFAASILSRFRSRRDAD